MVSQAFKSLGLSCNNTFTVNWGSTFCNQIMNLVLKRFFARGMFNRSSVVQELPPFLYFYSKQELGEKTMPSLMQLTTVGSGPAFQYLAL